MSTLHALVLGIIQGVTELLPISSSGHLIIVPAIFGWGKSPLVFDTTLHLGTALALTGFFWRDVVKIVRGFLSDLFIHKFKFGSYSQFGILGLGVLVGSVPAGIVGIVFGDFIEASFRGAGSVVLFLTVGSILMIAAELFAKPKIKSVENVAVSKSFLIGMFQSLALFSGVSRSGATISGGMLLGLERKVAAKYSFLLSIPIVAGTGIFEALKLLKSSGGGMPIPPPSFASVTYISPFSVAVGFLASFISGLIAVKLLMGFLEKHRLTGFIIYRIVLIIAISLML